MTSKRLIFNIGIAVIVFGVFATTLPRFVFADNPNLIANPNFTNATVSSSTPDSWFGGTFGNNNAVFTYPVVGQGGADDRAANINITSYTDGDAKWVFTPVPVTAGSQYLYSDSYLSGTTTQLAAVFCTEATCATPDFTHGQWKDILASTGGMWGTASNLFTVPAGFSYMRVYHVLFKTGSLSIDNASLVEEAPVLPFGKGFVSLTFDDGWRSQYVNAFPILKNAGYPASFYLITATFADATDDETPNILCNDNTKSFCDGAVISTTASSWTAATQFPDPVQDTYTFADTFTATTTSTITISYFDAAGQPIAGQQNIVLKTVPAGSNQNASVTFTVPPAVFSLITSDSSPSFTISHSVSGSNTISVTNPSLTEKVSTQDTYMTPADSLEMQAAGEEISAHTVNHCDLTMLDANPNSAMTGACASILDFARTALDEINESRQGVLAIGGTPVDTFVYPYGAFNSHIESLVHDAGFIAARSLTIGFNTRATDPYGLNTFIVDKSVTESPTGLDTIKSLIDQAIANKQWLVLTFHQVQTSADLAANTAISATTTADATSAEFFQQIVSYLQSQNACVTTFREGAEALLGTTDPICHGGDTVSPPPPPADTVPPVISNVPSDMTVYTATSTPVSVTFTLPTATDVVSGVVTVGCTPVSGSNFAVGTTTITCSASDAAHNTATASFNVGVALTSTSDSGSGSSTGGGGSGSTASTTPVVQITPTTLPNGIVGQAYSETFTASTTASGPFVWAVTSLPAGLSLSTTTGTISGTPTAAGTTNFSVLVTNGTASTTQDFSLLVNGAPVTSGGGGGGSSSGGGGGFGGGGGIIFGGGIISQNHPRIGQVLGASTVSMGEMMKQLRGLYKLLFGLQAKAAACSYVWNRNLSVGSSGEDVRQLQIALNTNPLTSVATSGNGSKGHETTYFGPATKAAVMKFQNIFAEEVLTSEGLTAPNGAVNGSMRTALNNFCASHNS